MINIDVAKAALSGYLESNASEIGRYLVQAIALWIKNRKHAERVIQEAHDQYASEMDAIGERIKGG